MQSKRSLLDRDGGHYYLKWVSWP